MYLAIEGVIGVGKTTLARLLQPVFYTELLLEVFEENPFLSNFYADRERYAFQTQTFFLLSRYHQHHRTVPDILAKKLNLIADYTFEKDTLFACINLKGDELDMYYRVHEALAERIPKPELVIYLRASSQVLMQRIASRDRAYERNMDQGYIDKLCEAYDQFFQLQNTGLPFLIIETDQLDFIKNPDHLKWVEDKIRQALQLPPFQQELPFEIAGKNPVSSFPDAAQA
jgi:deoxyguanosine kinase